MSQLDLFAYRKSTAQLHSFPCDRHVSFAHSVAQRLDVLDYAGGKNLWQAVCRNVRNGLKRDGLTTAEIRFSIDQLADQVHEALRYLHLQKQYRPSAVILSLTGDRIESIPNSDGAGEAGALGQGTKFLAGLGGAHETPEYDAAHAREGGAA
ncbi:hypothetical protein AMC82_CH03930 [Rhizobium phaseoli]|uniref:DUF6074 family protein n=1 Tax=Rhizobium phaseoli TaxID=396 RepID=UPI0007EBC1BF|nr:DUF6074 family protein [Rhizobium phaseoli]ANL55088.1 hypothetical protein AMC86_CH04006 [Rhizobium phaseoli]ANL67518.1 hypothetical protein AMC84_CH03944 [Rhizobium phaseoli]ANL80331.1 hypothetical protein AMC82_CH03930 [Rhizobium phaseoli]